MASRRSALVALCCCAANARWAAAASALAADEHVLLPPGVAGMQRDGRTTARIDAWVLEHEQRPGARQLLARYLAIDDDAMTSDERERFEARTQLLRVDAESGKRLQVEVDGGPPQTLAPTDHRGHVHAVLPIAARQGGQPQRIALVLRLRSGDARRIGGEVLWLPPRGTGFVIDIDDTIKHTQVRERKQMLLNTFAREMAAVPGMAAWLQGCAAADAGASFHYVSGSPHQLWPMLAEFLAAHGFPRGSVHLRSVDVKRDFFGAAARTREHKLAVIGRLMRDFGQRRFVLAGDSGELDPEVYGELARARPQQVSAILIRDVTGEAAGAPRYAQALGAWPRERFHLFTAPEGLPAAY